MRRAFEMWLTMIGLHYSKTLADNGAYRVGVVDGMWKAWCVSTYYALHGKSTIPIDDFEGWVEVKYGTNLTERNPSGAYISSFTAWMWLSWDRADKLAKRIAREHAESQLRVVEEAISIVKGALTK